MNRTLMLIGMLAGCVAAGDDHAASHGALVIDEGVLPSDVWQLLRPGCEGAPEAASVLQTDQEGIVALGWEGALRCVDSRRAVELDRRLLSVRSDPHPQPMDPAAGLFPGGSIAESDPVPQPMRVPHDWSLPLR